MFRLMLEPKETHKLRVYPTSLTLAYLEGNGEGWQQQRVVETEVAESVHETKSKRKNTVDAVENLRR